jgi:hypothetical protein
MHLSPAAVEEAIRILAVSGFAGIVETVTAVSAKCLE